MTEFLSGAPDSDPVKERLTQIRDELVELDPELKDLDLDNPEDVMVLTITAALLKGGLSFSMTSKDEDGRTETISFESLGTAEEGPLGLLTVNSSDGQLSADTADLVAPLMTGDLDAGLRDILGDQ